MVIKMNKLFYIFFFCTFFGFGQTGLKSRDKDEAKLFIDSLRNEIVKGTQFSVLAALYSEDPGSAKQGGLLSPFTRGQMVPEFESVAFKSEVGILSDVFETKFGFHILQVIGKEGEKVSARHILISFK